MQTVRVSQIQSPVRQAVRVKTMHVGRSSSHGPKPKLSRSGACCSLINACKECWLAVPAQPQGWRLLQTCFSLLPHWAMDRA